MLVNTKTQLKAAYYFQEKQRDGIAAIYIANLQNMKKNIE
jgi:hypothetical protein